MWRFSSCLVRQKCLFLQMCMLRYAENTTAPRLSQPSGAGQMCQWRIRQTNHHRPFWFVNQWGFVRLSGNLTMRAGEKKQDIRGNVLILWNWQPSDLNFYLSEHQGRMSHYKEGKFQKFRSYLAVLLFCFFYPWVSFIFVKLYTQQDYWLTN